uniref:Uncharacterized protein n=1 Tax=Sphingobacterium sp. (strain 21) TaxID=743722 RepID=F4CAD5_SPHS2
MRILLQPPTSFASKIGGQFATESYGQLHRNLHICPVFSGCKEGIDMGFA